MSASEEFPLPVVLVLIDAEHVVVVVQSPNLNLLQLTSMGQIKRPMMQPRVKGAAVLSKSSSHCSAQ
jgi:hypothetical protein